MSISEQIARIQSARNSIRQKLVALGLATSTDNIDTLATAINDIKDNGNISAEIKEGETFTIPAGFHNGSGTVSGIAGGGNYGLQSKTATPTKQQQSITPDEGTYGLSDVVIAPIPDLYQDVSSVNVTAAEILVGKTAVAKDGSIINGSMPNNEAMNLTIDGLTTTSVDIPAGFTTGGKVNLTGDILAELEAI